MVFSSVNCTRETPPSDALNNSFKSEIAMFDDLAKTYLDSDVKLINQIAHHLSLIHI